MNVDLPDVPDTIPRAQVMEAIRQLGVEPRHVREIHIHHGYMTVEMLGRDEWGKPVAFGDKVMTSTALVRIVDDDA